LDGAQVTSPLTKRGLNPLTLPTFGSTIQSVLTATLCLAISLLNVWARALSSRDRSK